MSSDDQYEVPARDRTGESVTLQLRPNSAVVTIEVVGMDGQKRTTVNISLADTGRFASAFAVCAHRATKRAVGEMS